MVAVPFLTTLGVAIVAVSRSGTLDYSLKLAGEASFIKWLVLIGPEDERTIAGRVRVTQTCRRGSFQAPLALASTIRKLGVSVVLLQYEYSMLGDPLLSHFLLILVLILLRVFRVKVVVTLHGVLTPSRLGFRRVPRVFLNLLVKAFYTILAHAADGLVVLNGIQLKLLLSLTPKAMGKVSIIPHGALLPEEMGPIPHSRSERFRIFFHGFLRPSKGVDLLLEALRILRERGFYIELKMLCSLPYMFFERRNEKEKIILLLRKIRSMREATVSIGFHDDREIIAEALSSNVIVLPYTDTYYESSGVLHKIMGCGKPIIVTPIPRFLGDLTPWSECLVTLPTPNSIAATIIKLMRDEGLSKRLALAARRKAEERKWKRVAKEYAMVLLRLIERAKSF
ncbi:MAG: glycosyltransferase [Candidatus Bathyarchaeia archaeon]